jgi:hypothetical protein
MASFDWYQGTIPNPVDDVLEVLNGLAPGLVLSHQRGMHGYASTAVLGSEAEGAVAKVWHGGTHEYPHVVLSGHWAQSGGEAIRLAFPIHSVSRLDVREDYSDEGCFDRIVPVMVDASQRHRVSRDCRGDWAVPADARSFYLGSTSSAVRLRLYDKRAEMLSGLASEVDRMEAARSLNIPDQLARLEAQIRPEKKEAKARFASIEPVDALGCSRWMREVWKAVAGLDLTPVQVGRGYRRSDDERAYRYLLAHYGGLLRRLHCELGSWDCVGLQLGQDLSVLGGRSS